MEPTETGDRQIPDQRFLPSGDEAGSAPEDRAFRPDVEGLRAVAILLVVFVHVGIPGFGGGLIGVDVFFVISGFVITGLLLREQDATGSIRFLSFYARRARRILPAAILVIIVTLVATDVLVSHRLAVLVASDARWTTTFLGNFHFGSVTPTVFTPRPQTPLFHYWSLAVEEQFYLIYPAFFVGLMALPGKFALRNRLALGLAAIIVISFISSVLASKPGLIGPFVSPFTHAWELALGGLVAVMTKQLRRIPSAVGALMTWTGVLLIGIATETITIQTAYPGYAAALPVVGAVLVVAGGASKPRLGAEVVLGTPIFRWLGRRSYSWYLWHWPVLVIAASYAHRTVYGNSIVENLCLASAALVLAAITYVLVENPIRHSGLFRRKPRATLAGALLLIASCVALTFAF